MRLKHLTSVQDFDFAEIKTIFELAKKIKRTPSAYQEYLKGKTAALVFEKPSTRTRVSFEAGLITLGGSAIYLGPNDIQFGVREEVKDIARTLSRYIDLVVLRTFSHDAILEFARHFQKPVVNGLSNLEHPCQALSDFFTIEEVLGGIRGKKIVYVGDPNNVCNSLLLVAARLGAHFVVVSPARLTINPKVLETAKKEAKNTGAKLEFLTNPGTAVKGADIIYTDVWVSMGEEAHAHQKRASLKGFQVNAVLLKKAKKDVRVMHCLPAHRGEEITNDVLESKASVVFDQAENRLHVQKAILVYLFGSNVYRPYSTSKQAGHNH